MKDCCKTGETEPDKTKTPWGKWLLYTTIVTAIVVVIIEQISY